MMIQPVELHMYALDQWYIVPQKVAGNGLLVEVSPVFVVEIDAVEQLARALVEARKVSASLDRHASWDGEQGRVWKSAKYFWTVAFLEDGSIEIDQSVRDLGEDNGGLRWQVLDDEPLRLPRGSSEEDVVTELFRQRRRDDQLTML